MKTITQKEYIIYFFISLCFVALNFATIKTLLPWVSYIQYTVSPAVMERIGSPYLYITSVFVLDGLIRYLQNTIVGAIYAIDQDKQKTITIGWEWPYETGTTDEERQKNNMIFSKILS